MCGLSLAEMSLFGTYLYKQTQYLPRPTKVQSNNPADTDRVIVTKAQNLIERVQSVPSDD
jgi:hypothetical protein